MNHKTFIFLMILSLESLNPARGQDATQLVRNLKSKLDQVSSYEAEGTMKTNVPFLKVPAARVKIFYKKPDKFRVKNEQGISLVPKTISSISLNSLVDGNYSILDAGREVVSGQSLRVIKLLPSDENQEIVLSTLYIDEKDLLIVRARTTTKENGTYEVELAYGKYSSYALPDKVICRFNSKDYKLPKGVTFDYDDGSNKKKEDQAAGTKGQVEIIYNSYQINKNIPDSVF
jgi:outer membrane lipoprotein-sorting protein